MIAPHPVEHAQQPIAKLAVHPDKTAAAPGTNPDAWRAALLLRLGSMAVGRHAMLSA